MKNNPLLIVCMGTIMAVSGCASPPMIDVNAEADAIRELDQEWQAAAAAKDVDALLSYYAPDVVKMAANAPAEVGRESLREDYETLFSDPSVSYGWSADVIEVAASGDMAYVRGTYEFTSPFEDVGKYLSIWKKIEGEWKVVAECVNSDMPLPEG